MSSSSISAIFLLFGSIVHGQTPPSLQPPSQTYVYEFTSPVSAAAPLAPALNLGASYSFEILAMFRPRS
jgi:hypothetical protein